MTRAFVLVLESLGVGGAVDAAHCGDAGADTLGHIAQRCAAGDADRAGIRSGPLRVPRLASLGLAEACREATGSAPAGIDAQTWRAVGLAGCAAESAPGRDSHSGQWEIAGVRARTDWGRFPDIHPCFPAPLIESLCRRARLPSILGQRHATSHEIIAELGMEHLRSGKPICYTSGGSVFQIAAHENRFGLTRLYGVCRIARELLDPMRVARVIASPFTGRAGDFHLSVQRRDFGMSPAAPTLFTRARDASRDVISIGKTSDLFRHEATGIEYPGGHNEQAFEELLEGARILGEGGLLFADFADFDALYGHRRDVTGYAAALEAFDSRLPELQQELRKDDVVVITADHGCDPTWRGSGHTRECVPVLAFGPRIARGRIGRRDSFCDIGASVARWLGLIGQRGVPF